LKYDPFGEDSLDVVIDDGSHKPLHQLLTVAYFLPKLKPGGMIVIEDVADPNTWPLFESFEANMRVIDLRKGNPYNSVLIVFYKEK